MAERRSHLVLLGDSIFDNGAYTDGQPDVAAHLARLLPPSWQLTLCAVDGATAAALPAQLTRMPPDASHLAIAIGGNDALQNRDLLARRVETSGQFLDLLADRVHAFERRYRSVIAEVPSARCRTLLCTVYNGALPPDEAPRARVALAAFNDAIVRTALDLSLDVLELRSICTTAADYANPIEPSGEGGLKIARAIARAFGLGTPAGAKPIHLWGADRPQADARDRQAFP